MHNPDLYEQNNVIQKRDAVSSLKKYAPTLKWKPDNNRIIDIGCGDGSVTKILKEFLPTDHTLVGCDISEDMILFASNNHSDEKTYFTILDIAGDLPEDMTGNFDHVFSFYVLNWVKDQKRAFQNIFDLMEQDGECFMILLAYCSVYEAYRTLAKNSKWSTWVYDVEKYVSPYHDSEEPDKDITKLMESIGFVDVNVKCNDNFFLFDNEDMRKNAVIAVIPFEIPKDKKDEFINDCLQIMDDIESVLKANTNHSPNDITFYYKLVTMCGRKPLTPGKLDL